jgi:phosphoadenosine phosphosulfate reductase
MPRLSESSPNASFDRFLNGHRQGLAPSALNAKAAALDAAHGNKTADRVLELVVNEKVAGPIALVSSFGAESVVLLHLAAAVDRDLPIIFIDTGRLFPETLAYRDTLVARLGLRDVRTVGPERDEAEKRDPYGAMFVVDPDGCCHFRKVEPLARGLRPFDAWITGRKRHQAATRAAIPIFEADATHIKVNPLAAWSPEQILAYMRAYELPFHPLRGRGYRSIGCVPCTSPVAAGEDARAGRWRDQGKTECGIHVAAAGAA